MLDSTSQLLCRHKDRTLYQMQPVIGRTVRDPQSDACWAARVHDEILI